MLSYFKGRRVAKRYLAPYRSALDMERGGGGGGGGGGHDIRARKIACCLILYTILIPALIPKQLPLCPYSWFATM